MYAWIYLMSSRLFVLNSGTLSWLTAETWDVAMVILECRETKNKEEMIFAPELNSEQVWEKHREVDLRGIRVKLS